MAFFRVKAVVTGATDYVASHLQQPSVDTFAQWVQQYCEAAGEAISLNTLDRFIAQIGEQLKLRTIKADPLVIYGLRCDTARKLGIPD